VLLGITKDIFRLKPIIELFTETPHLSMCPTDQYSARSTPHLGLRPTKNYQLFEFDKVPKQEGNPINPNRSFRVKKITIWAAAGLSVPIFLLLCKSQSSKKDFHFYPCCETLIAGGK